MTPRRRAILILGLILLLIGIVVFVIVMLTRVVSLPEAGDPVVEPPADVVDTTDGSVAKFDNPLLIPAPVTDARTESRQIAELFAERYGSYSNQGDYQNLRDLLPVMTTRYRAETEAFLEGAETTPGQPYEGVTSQRISTSVREIDSDSAVIAISLQQERSSGTSAPIIAYRTLRMGLLKVGDEWLVDRASWED